MSSVNNNCVRIQTQHGQLTYCREVSLSTVNNSHARVSSVGKSQRHDLFRFPHNDRFPENVDRRGRHATDECWLHSFTTSQASDYRCHRVVGGQRISGNSVRHYQSVSLRSIVMSMSVCLFVCLPVHKDISETTRAIFTNFLCMLTDTFFMFTTSRIAYRREGVFFPNENALSAGKGGLKCTARAK